MYIPVSAENVFQTPEGIEFENRFLKDPSDPLGVFTDRVPGGLRNDIYRTSDEEIEQRLDLLANWLTGNYDSETNTHTLYRGIDDERLQDFRSSGSLTSKVVDFFGNGDTVKAIKNLKKAENGKLSREMKQKGSVAVSEMEDYLKSHNVQPDDSRWQSFADTQALFAGRPSEKTSQVLHSTRQLLSTVETYDAHAYKAVVERAGNDDTFPRLPSALLALTYPSIHLTTDPNFVRDRALRSGWFNNALKVTFEPGRLPVAPNVGMLKGKLLTTDFPAFHEREWYGIGKLDGNLPGVIIEEVPELLDKSQ
jgi:hypothetical protein